MDDYLFGPPVDIKPAGDIVNPHVFPHVTEPVRGIGDLTEKCGICRRPKGEHWIAALTVAKSKGEVWQCQRCGKRRNLQMSYNQNAIDRSPWLPVCRKCQGIHCSCPLPVEILVSALPDVPPAPRKTKRVTARQMGKLTAEALNMTREEYIEHCAPIHEMISYLRKRHAEELAPWFDRLMAINNYYFPPIIVQASEVASWPQADTATEPKR